MSNWTAITLDHLKAAAHGALIDAAQTTATGAIDPVVEAIADVTARVRRAVSTGNVLDADAGKVPNSLRALAIRLIIFALSERIGDTPTDTQRETRREDFADLKRIADNRIKVETPDTPASSSEMQATGGAIEAINVPTRLTGRDKLGGL